MIRGVAFQLVFPMYDSTTGLLKTGLAPTVTLSKDGGADAGAAGAVAEIGTTGRYKVTLTTTEMDASVISVLATATGASSTTALIATDADTYQAKVSVTDDDGGTNDRYTVAWFKNGEPIVAGITTPLIQVIKVADGSDLVASTAMTQIGALGMYRYNEPTNRIVDGVAYIVKATATIAGTARTWNQPISRDS